MTATSQSRGGGIAQQIEQLNGSHEYLGTIQSTGTNVISNLTSQIVKGGRYLVQADAPGYINPGNHATTPVVPNVTNSAVNGLKLAADEKYLICLAQDDAPGSANG